MVHRRHVAKTVKEGDVSMTVTKHCVSRRWIVPFLKSRIHYLAARRPAMGNFQHVLRRALQDKVRSPA
jgi:hypothetical protein